MTSKQAAVPLANPVAPTFRSHDTLLFSFLFSIFLCFVDPLWADGLAGWGSQMAWNTSVSLGCAANYCTTSSPFGLSYPNWYIVMCVYATPGPPQSSLPVSFFYLPSSFLSLSLSCSQSHSYSLSCSAIEWEAVHTRHVHSPSPSPSSAAFAFLFTSLF